jgi:hypothetical protein
LPAKKGTVIRGVIKPINCFKKMPIRTEMNKYTFLNLKKDEKIKMAIGNQEIGCKPAPIMMGMIPFLLFLKSKIKPIDKNENDHNVL